MHCPLSHFPSFFSHPQVTVARDDVGAKERDIRSVAAQKEELAVQALAAAQKERDAAEGRVAQV